MARIPAPRYEARLSPDVGGAFQVPATPRRPSVPPPNVPFRGAVPGSAAALQDLGGAIASFAGDLAQLQQQRQETADAAWFSRARAQTAIDWLQRESALQRQATAPAEGSAGPPGGPPLGAGGNPGSGAGAAGAAGAGYTETALKDFDAYRADVLKGAPSERARQLYQQWSELFSADVANSAYKFEQVSLFAERADSLNAAFEAHVQTVFANPDDYDTVLAQARDDLAAAAAWMTPEQEIKARRDIETALQQARAKKLAHFEPLRLEEELGLAQGPVMGAAAKIIAIEGTAKNPKSSAAGVGQFIDSTWLAVVRKHRPDLAELSDREILALKADPELGREMTLRLTEDNINGLVASGIDPSEAAVYLAHFAGLEGARQLMTADDGQSVEAILGHAAIAANPQLRGMTVADIKRWAAAKMAGTAPADLGSFVDNPKYSRLTPDQIFSLAADANQALLRQHNAAVAEAQAVYAARLNGLENALLDGQAGMADITQARQDGWLWSYDDIAKVTGIWTKQNAEAAKTGAAMAKVANPDYRFSWANPDDKSDANLYYRERGGATGLADGDPTAVRTVQEVIRRTGIVPEDAADALRGGMTERQPAALKSAFDVAVGLARAWPDAMNRVLSSDEWQQLQDYQALAGVVPDEELWAELNPHMDPQRKKRVDEVQAEGRKLAAETPTAEIIAGFDPPGLFNQPAAPADPVTMQALVDDYREAYAHAYARSGNPDDAKKAAITWLTDTKWGVTEAGSTRQIMAFPPEKYYLAGGEDGGWVGDQLAAQVEEDFPDAQRYELIASPNTDTAIRAGAPPSYWISVVDKDGVRRLVTHPDGAPIDWMPDRQLHDDETRGAFAASQAQRARSIEAENARRRAAGLPEIGSEPSPWRTPGGPQ